MIRALLLAALLIPVSAVAQHESSTRLANLLTDRLSLMHDVAAYKWLHQLPVEDLQREDIVIKRAVIKGLEHNIDPASTRRIFSAQIEAAKEIQQCWMESWAKGNAPRQAPDLASVTRPALIDLGDKIMDALGNHPDELTTLAPVQCLSAATATSLISAINSISYLDDVLVRIRQGGILRVGMTRDYQPFSYSESAGTYRGIDLDLAIDLAESLGVGLSIIPTSWPTLSKDLAANKFDIAMSGVSIIDSRRKIGHFSIPYHVGGKSPITRCERVREFDSLEKIDQPGVRLIVNPGGTNERFLDSTIKQATKVLHEDNRTIFQAILDGKADLMITDLIEAKLQSHLLPELCAAMPGKTLTYQEKGIFMQPHSGLKMAIDDWLATRIEDGTVAEIFETHLH